MTIEAIALIIVTVFITAFVNLAVSNYIFYRYQKNIESSYNMQLEEFKTSLDRINLEFKASLDRINFEYQTKLSRKLPKNLEVLETICQKYVNFIRTYLDLRNPLGYYLATHKKDGAEVLKTIKQIYLKSFDNIWEYYESNRIFLSKESIETIQDVLFTTQHIGETISLLEIITDETRKQNLELINRMIRTYKLDLSPINPDDESSDFLYLFNLWYEYDKLSLRLEQHYKSIIGE